jgi:acrylyl-CoA reductase (NADPH)
LKELLEEEFKMEGSFRALVAAQKDGHVEASVQTLQQDALPEGDVLIKVAYSSLNYKDGLAVTGKGKVVRSYPIVPGIDLVGTILESASPDYHVGNEVILTGWGIGERYWGGFAQLARAQAKWLVPLPTGLTPRQAMGIGTAGFTAMLCVIALEAHGLKPGDEEVLVTGASGGVGSVAVAILAKLGYNVVASTGRAEAHEYLSRLGARTIIDRAVLATPSGRPLDSARWAGAIDTVGGQTLASILSMLKYRASVAACGLVGGNELPATVFPFVLRGVNLLGIDSNMSPIEERRETWTRLVQDLPLDLLEEMIEEIPLSDVPAFSQQIVKGHIRGRVVVDVNAE